MDCPRLRRDLQELRTPWGELEGFFDPVLGRRVELGPIARALVARIDGARTIDQAVESAAEALAAPRALVEVRARSLFLLNVLEGSGVQTLERARGLSRGEFAVRMLPGTRFRCQGSGACCRGYHFGALRDEDKKRLQALDLAGAGFGPGPWTVEREGPDPPKGTYLAVREDGSCTFLREDKRCGLQVAFGVEAKPGFCRAYPFRLLATLHGLKALDGGECASFAASARAGPPLDAAADVLPAFAPVQLQVDHPVVHLGLETPCDLGYVLEIQEAVVRRLERPAPLGEALLDSVRSVLDVVAALASCPLAPGEPGPTLDLALARLAARPHVPVGPASREAWQALARLAAELHAAHDPAGKGATTRDGAERELLEVLALAKAFATHGADPRVPLGETERAVASVTASDPPSGGVVDEALGLSLRDMLWGDQLLVENRVLPGLVRIATILFLAVVGAKLRASRAGAAAVRVEDVGRAHSHVQRIFRRGRAVPVFARHDGAARPVAEAVAAWLSGHPGSTPPVSAPTSSSA